MEDRKNFFLRIKFEYNPSGLSDYVLQYSFYGEDGLYSHIFEYIKEPWEKVGTYKRIQGTYLQMEERAKEFTSREKVEEFKAKQKELEEETINKILEEDKENRPYLIKQII